MSAPWQLEAAERCGAKTRSGKACQAPKVAGRKRCRMHGGAHGSGAPKGERNGAWKGGISAIRAAITADRSEIRKTRNLIDGLLKELDPRPVPKFKPSDPVECFVCEASFRPSDHQHERRAAGGTRFRCSACTPLQMTNKILGRDTNV